MPNFEEFLQYVKRAAVEAVRAERPFSFCVGTVTATKPLTIKLDQKHELAEKQLLLTNAVRDYTVEMTVDHQTGKGLSGDWEHTHTYKGRKSYTVHLGLKVGEKVLLLQTDGGQRYIILDRVEAPT